MKRTHLSAAIAAPIPCLATLAALVSRNPAIPQKATKRTKAQSLGNARVLLWPKRSLIGDQSQTGWITACARQILRSLRFLLWTTGWVQLRNTRTRLFAVAMSLASCTFVVTESGGLLAASTPATVHRIA